MKNPKTTSVLVGLGLVLVLAFGYAQGRPPVNNTSTNTFINNTGQAVGGLTIQYSGVDLSLGVFFYQDPPGTFGNVQEDSNRQLSLSSGTVEAGGGVRITISSPAATHIRINKWWWTDGSGMLVGKTHNGCTNPDCTSP